MNSSVVGRNGGCMAEALIHAHQMTMTEYIEWESQADYRSEYVDGELFAMAGGSYRHSAICANLHRSIGNRLLEKECTVFDSNLKLAVPSYRAFLYPDLMVVCGAIECFEDHEDIIQNPILIVEVLSPSTELFDRGKKFAYYRSLPSLQEYVLVSQEAVSVEVFTKRVDGNWFFSALQEKDASVALHSLACEIPVSEIYRNIH